jgi:ABC-type Fe3+-hydroxamate transport system substrate-binding protein
LIEAVNSALRELAVTSAAGRRCGRRVALLLAGVLTAIATVAADASQFVVDSTGRRVEIPDRIARVQPAGPPATVLIYALAREKLIGWVRKPREAELPISRPLFATCRKSAGSPVAVTPQTSKP